ncbi:MAG: hypothetical protein WD794_09025 [Mycobacteriales bacterium]
MEKVLSEVDGNLVAAAAEDGVRRGFIEDSMTVTEQPELFRTATGDRLRIRPCPHLRCVDNVFVRT